MTEQDKQHIKEQIASVFDHAPHEASFIVSREPFSVAVYLDGAEVTDDAKRQAVQFVIVNALMTGALELEAVKADNGRDYLQGSVNFQAGAVSEDELPDEVKQHLREQRAAAEAEGATLQ